MFLFTGCSGSDGDSTDTTQIELPVDFALTLSCENAGIFPEKCVLFDPENPYLAVYIDEENKWDLHNASPSAKSNYYLWTTTLARTPNGENQYYTASALHTLFTEGGSTNAKTQAIRAYRSVLDNFYDDVTYFIADWLPKDENLVDDVKAGGTCAPVTDNSTYANRLITVSKAPVVLEDTFGSCSPCAEAQVPAVADADNLNYSATIGEGSPLYNVTFSVDMNCLDVSEDVDASPEKTVAITGPFCNWCDSEALPLADADGDGIWKGTYAFSAGDIEYKYIVNNWKYPVLLRDLTGGRLSNPGEDNLSTLFPSEDYTNAMDALEDWGYSYDVDSGELDAL
jgi:hypothetical protein